MGHCGHPLLASGAGAMFLAGIGTELGRAPKLAALFYLAAIALLVVVFIRANLFRANPKQALIILALTAVALVVLWITMRPSPPLSEKAIAIEVWKQAPQNAEQQQRAKASSTPTADLRSELRADGNRESIAVMPFINETGDNGLEYLSDGIPDTLIRSLSQAPNLTVKSRSAVFYYKGKEISPKRIGEELNVQAVLLGRLVQQGNELKLNLELVNTQTLDLIWSGEYPLRRSDLISLQNDITKDVVAKLKLKLSRADEAKVTKISTANPEAYQAYFKRALFLVSANGRKLE